MLPHTPKILLAKLFIPPQPRNFKIVGSKVFNTRLGSVVRVRLGFVVRRSMLLGSPLGEASPKTFQNMVEQFLWAFIVYGGIQWCVISCAGTGGDNLA